MLGGAVNAAADDQCRRCGAGLTEDDSLAPEPFAPEPDEPPRKRSLIKRLLWIISATLLILIVWYLSLLISSDRLQPDQALKVDVAIALLEQTGFTREGFVLRHATMFRSTDNWWNRWLGHHDAYAATNFPFEIVTLYPEFFNDPVDDQSARLIA